MKRMLRSALIVSVLIGSGFAAVPFSARPAHATASSIAPQAVPNPNCDQGSFNTGALYMYCKPLTGWNGDLVVWAHGYTNPGQPLGIPITLPDGTSLATLVQSLGYAFGATSYRVNGLAILPGVDDMSQLVRSFPVTMGVPQHVYITGASEGGIVTALSMERHPNLYTAGLSACGPIGDFPGQMNYWGNYRILFDYFFPGIFPTSVITVPQQIIDNWNSVYVPQIANELTANMTDTRQLITTAHAPTDPNNYQATAVTATQDVMGYNAFATNNGIQVLHGVPFSNTTTLYHGSLNDTALNQQVYRVSAAPAALATMRAYQTSGLLTKPMVTLHTTGDDVIPYWHEILYGFKAHFSGQGSLVQVAVHAFGHCNFTVSQILLSFFIMLSQAHDSRGMAILARQPEVARLLTRCEGTWKTQARHNSACTLDGPQTASGSWADRVGAAVSHR